MSDIQYIIEDGSRTLVPTPPPPDANYTYDIGDRFQLAMPDGGTVVFYELTRSRNQSSDVLHTLYVQRFDAAGNAVGSPVQAGNAASPTFTGFYGLTGVAFEDGSFAFQTSQLSGYPRYIFDFAPDGTFLNQYPWPEFASDITDMIRLPDGSLQVYYDYLQRTEQGVETRDVRVAILDDGTTTTLNLVADPAGDQRSVRAAELGSGSLVIWQDAGPEGGNGTFNLVGERVDASGQRIGTSFTIATSTSGFASDVFALADGNAAVVWGDGGDLHVRRYGTDGQPVGTEVVVPDVSGGSVTVLPDGTIVWSRPEDAETDRAIIQLFDPSGNALGDPFYAAEQTEGQLLQYNAETGQLFINSGFPAVNTQYVYDLPDRFFGTANPDTLTGGDGRDILLGYEGDDILSGLLGADQIDGGAGNDQIFGGGGNDRLWGEAGNDLLVGGLGDDEIFGGIGTDVARFSGNRGDYTIERLDDGRVRITGADGVDTLSGVERAEFDDGTINIGLFGNPTLAIASFGYSDAGGGWVNNTIYPRAAADVNGDGRADLIGFGSAGVYVALATGNGNFAAPTLAYQGFGAADEAGGWADANRYPRMLADVNGDGNADIVGFGAAGTYVALADGNGGFGATLLATANFGTNSEAGGWVNADRYPRVMGDVNGDGRADIVGFAANGTYVALGQANGTFGEYFLGIDAFGESPSAGGFTSNDRYPRTVADVNGDGRADLVGFGSAGAFVALGETDGTFGDYFLATNAFGTAASAGGWSSDDLLPREVADVNGDGRADIVGFGRDGLYVAYGQSDGTFGAWEQALEAFGSSDSAGGWSSNDRFPRIVADVDGDGHADLIGFGADGTFVSLSNDIGVF
ncbi:FG-GAP-like repeat-containing protein [Alteriqipengyuania lutimaris]|uniref:FG-GAP-like repeat-containing protein n=1 Tax=Alteriqipengyuania lutimaris TaxID=1538146 RepID=UPI001CFC6877|nr:VCBS repeat-containing protein [Alteriqipengyuania lutimaris]